MAQTPFKTTREAARRFLRKALLLDAPVATVEQALDHMGYVQIDPINICGRMHDLILRNRVVGYTEDALHAHIHSQKRPGFEHYLPGDGVLVAFPIDAWPHLIERTRHRRAHRGGYAGKLTSAEEKLAKRIESELADRGPLTSDAIEHDQRAYTAWGSGGRMVKIVLEKMMVHGRVFISRRSGFRRVYDLPGRVLPPELLGVESPAPEETLRWLARLRLRQRRLVNLKKAERPWVGDFAHPVQIDGLPLLHCLTSDLPLLERAGATPSPEPLLLAPLDPLVYDRKLTFKLWDYDYTWEVYTPAHKRKRGYYALPILAGAHLVGHVDLKSDRSAGKLKVVSRRVPRSHKITAATLGLARFLGLRR